MEETKKSKALNLPNMLSLLRMLLVPFFVLSVLVMDMATPLGRIVPALIFAITALTDCLDGQIARRCHMVTNFGKFLDPLADKFMVFSALLVMVYRYQYLHSVFLWCAVIIIFRDLAVTSLRLVAAGQSAVIAASWPGKLKTVSQILGILVIILEPLAVGLYGAEIYPASYVMMALMTLTSLFSGWDYLRAYLPVLDLTK